MHMSYVPYDSVPGRMHKDNDHSRGGDQLNGQITRHTLVHRQAMGTTHGWMPVRCLWGSWHVWWHSWVVTAACTSTCL